MRISVAANTDSGRRYDHNEDAYFASPPLVAVADGVGGNNAGEVASNLALEVLSSWLDELGKHGAARLKAAVDDANRAVYTMGKRETTLSGMATTLTAAWIERGTATLAHVGDSRAYLLRDGALTQLTEDQSIVAQMVREGRLTSEEAWTHPWRNRILQALGGSPDVAVEILSVDLAVGDRLILASDGLTDELRDEEIREILRSVIVPEDAARTLVAAANAAGGGDNITVVVVDVVANGEPDATPPRRGFIRRRAT